MPRRLVVLRARVGAGLIALAAIAGSAAAQGASVQATAAVSIPMAVTGLAPLDFGQVVPGIPKTIAFNAAGSGRLRINGNGSSQVSIILVMPTTLSNGVATMPVGSWDVRTNNNNNVNGTTPFVFTSGTPVLRTLHPSGSMFFFVGGRVTPAGTQAAGSYTGTITIVSAYTGL